MRGPFVRLGPHRDAVGSVDDLGGWLADRHGPRAVDLFCGCGGLSLGLEAAGFDVILGVDHDPEAVETHRHHFGGLTVDWDLASEDAVERVAAVVRDHGVTLVAGGPPCQPFSKAGRYMLRELVRTGRRPEHDHRRELWQSFLRVVELSRPPAVLMENVPDMVLDRDMLILRTMVERLEELDYSVAVKLVETWRYGVPQFRTRLILVALADQQRFDWPDALGRRVTVLNAIGDLPPVTGGARPDGGAEGWWPYDRPVTSFQRRARAGLPGGHRHRIYDHITRPVREDDAKVFASLDHSTRYSEIADDLKRYRDDIFEDKYKRLNGDDLSRTITAHIAKDGYWYIHPTEDRTLTIREAARIQTFPDRFRFAGPPSAGFRQIGNAVPPLLGEVVGGAVLRSLERRIRRTDPTRLVSTALAVWWDAQTDAGTLQVPWMGSGNRWLVLQCELLLDRAALPVVRSLWPLLEKLVTPADTRAAQDQLREMAGWLNRENRVARLLAAADWFDENPEGLDTLDGIRACPDITPAIAELAVRAAPGPDEDPVIVSQPLLRIAARMWGEPVDRMNKTSDGRIAVARLVGADPVSDGAHLALFELGRTVCTPARPACHVCPLRPWCATAAVELSERPRLSLR